MTSKENKMVSVSEIDLETDPHKGNMVILRENAESDYYLLMFVGDADFAAIAKEKGLIRPNRPLTHDLYLKILETVDLNFLRVEINDMRNETFYATVFFSANGEEHSVDSRPSDAIVIAMNKNIPILVRKDLFRRKLTHKEMQEYEKIVKTVRF